MRVPEHIYTHACAHCLHMYTHTHAAYPRTNAHIFSASSRLNAGIVYADVNRALVCVAIAIVAHYIHIYT